MDCTQQQLSSREKSLCAKMAEAACAYPVMDRPEWETVADAIPGAVILHVDSSRCGYSVEANGCFSGKAGILLERQNGAQGHVLCAIVRGSLDEKGQPVIQSFDFTRALNQIAANHGKLSPAENRAPLQQLALC